jgi:hypothetical protein
MSALYIRRRCTGEVVMKQEAKTNPGKDRAVSLSAPAGQMNTPWGKADEKRQSPAPPPVWTRYIDSRLKQFCVR